ncbi:hypothetical protein GCM10010451_49090 [Streptomyces virens]|uniref:Uncharacterized protein n=1 Tax=Streptomyces virens TaxID=285572 RepID=A0ABP6PWC8_9ACTN|nr:hypothetical protein GCM10010247_44600 [Streptomyces calvus]
MRYSSTNIAAGHIDSLNYSMANWGDRLIEKAMHSDAVKAGVQGVVAVARRPVPSRACRTARTGPPGAD